jgi:hypothetical protein
MVDLLSYKKKIKIQKNLIIPKRCIGEPQFIFPGLNFK